MLRLACAGMLCVLAGVVVAADYRVGADEYREQLRRLQPGDRLLLAPGDYLQGLPLHHLSGQAGDPIVIEAADPASPPRFIARPRANTVSLVNVRHLVVRHLVLDGRNLPVDAVKAEGHSRYADFITLEYLHIHDHAASQQNVGISTKCPAYGWVVRNNRIERVGTGMYFGNSDGGAPFIAGLIEGNHVSATRGYNLQIKHQAARTPEYAGRHDTLIRHNVFSKQDAVPGPLARPNVLLGHVPVSGPGSEDRYLVHGNLFLHNPSEALLQAEGRVAVYDNVFINGAGDAIRIQPHNDVPREMDLFSNTVLAAGTGIQVRQHKGATYRQRVILNVVAAATPIVGAEAAHNLALAYQPDLLELAPGRLTPHLLARSKAMPHAPAPLLHELMAYPDWQRTPRPGASMSPTLLPALDAATP
ncbi:MAG: hypothetical protein ACLGGY_05445 [Gammaproteobacteria bacterium]